MSSGSSLSRCAPNPCPTPHPPGCCPASAPSIVCLLSRCPPEPAAPDCLRSLAGAHCDRLLCQPQPGRLRPNGHRLHGALPVAGAAALRHQPGAAAHACTPPLQEHTALPPKRKTSTSRRTDAPPGHMLLQEFTQECLSLANQIDATPPPDLDAARRVDLRHQKVHHLTPRHALATPTATSPAHGREGVRPATRCPVATLTPSGPLLSGGQVFF